MEWRFYSGVDSYSPSLESVLPDVVSPREDLLCQLESSPQWDTAHRLLSVGYMTNSRIVERDGVRYSSWNGLVLVDNGKTITPDPRSRACLVRRWRDDPPRPDLCWQELMGGEDEGPPERIRE